METADDASPPLLGRLLDDRYRLDRLIARGGMATVFVATDTRLDRQVAVKVMHRALADDPEFVARFTREAKAAARVSAPEVVAVHDQGNDRETGLAYLVMEHVKGINLRQLLVERGTLTPARAVSLIEPVLRALAAAHLAGLVHRDIKPENVLLGDDGQVKVADFGLARAVESSNLTQTTGLLIGTVAYLAPEQVESGTADARSDVYAAGVLLWELLTGVPPYDGEKPLSVAYRHVHEDVPPPSTVAPDVPPELDELVVRATRRNPDFRPADGGEFLAALLALKPGLPATVAPTTHQTLVVARPVPGAVPSLVPLRTAPETTEDEATGAPPPLRRGRLWLALLLVVSLLALGGGYYLGSFRYTQAPSVLAKSLTQAETTLKAEGLRLTRGPDRFSETVAKGLILDQDPKPQGKVRKGGKVTVNVSKGPDRRAVPALAGKSLAAATTALAAVGLVVAEGQTQEFSQTVGRGLVIRSDPATGVVLKPGSAVRLVLSKGVQPVEVPSVRGKKRREAVEKLDSAGFLVTVQEVFSDDVDKDLVVSQSPANGTAPRGSTVVLQISKGPDLVKVPDVRGEKAADGRRLLTEAGFVVNERELSGGPGRVLQTDPKGGHLAKRGSTITMFVF